MHRYSSVSAFLAHYHALKKISASALNDEDRNRLAAIETLLDLLRPEERGSIEVGSEDPAVARHSERASLRLRRELMTRGVIDG
ncbi:MAG TPA: hypothetical protein VN867_11805 [Candidatus Binataceae bacterium]|nr:hypothetical protein [Candidatus Binataceae bacterium]